MNRVNIEKLKNIIITVLFMTSLIQVGILWNIQNHGLPISFLSGLFERQGSIIFSGGAEAIYDKYFYPYRVIISDGLAESYWFANRKSKDFSELWSIGKYYMQRIADNDTVQGDPQAKASDSSWPELFQKTAVIIDFKSGLQKELLAALLQVNNPDIINLPPVVNKIVISPLDDINQNINTVYLVNDDLTYKYTITVKDERFGKQRILDVIDKYSGDGVSREYIADFKGTLTFKTASDLLLSVTGNKYDRIRSVISDTPEFLTIKDPDEAAEIILGNKKFSFYNAKQTDNSIEFKNFNNIYRFTPEGVFEYKYLESEKAQIKGNAAAAFENTINFMEPVKGLLKGTDLRLSGVTAGENGLWYEFTFDYEIDGQQVFVRGVKGSSGGEAVNNAIKIKANSKRVLSCIWLLKDFNISQEKVYNVNHLDLIDSLSRKLGTEYEKNFSIREISIGYNVEPGNSAELLDPVWGISTLDGILHTIEMESK